MPHDATCRSKRASLPELLAPAGTLDAFKAAIAAGADAVYCGMGSFNARRNADNLDGESFAAACRMAHLAGSRVYVTVNILIREDELADALRLVHDCARSGADAFIVQDWGLLRLVHELWPDLELHLSTQANVHDPRGVRFAKRRGCSRVTLSRELSLGEIEACSHEGVELEVFGHGALCVCYSGECLLSSAQRGRSANRGLCRQPCRLPYRMYDEAGAEVARVGGTRLLSPRDNCTIGDLEALVGAGCGALKIEGRMKAPDYVGTVVGAYRRALDELAEGKAPSADAEVMRALARAFNRDFTDAYLHGESGNDMMSYERGNNRGQLAGRVCAAGGKLTRLSLDEPVGAGDLLEIRNPDRFDDYVTVPSPRDAGAGEVLEMRLPRPMGVGCAVRVIRSEEGMARARAYAAREWPRKRARARARRGAHRQAVRRRALHDRGGRASRARKPRGLRPSGGVRRRGGADEARHGRRPARACRQAGDEPLRGRIVGRRARRGRGHGLLRRARRPCAGGRIPSGRPAPTVGKTRLDADRRSVQRRGAACRARRGGACRVRPGDLPRRRARGGRGGRRRRLRPRGRPRAAPRSERAGRPGRGVMRGRRVARRRGPRARRGRPRRTTSRASRGSSAPGAPSSAAPSRGSTSPSSAVRTRGSGTACPSTTMPLCRRWRGPGRAAHGSPPSSSSSRSRRSPVARPSLWAWWSTAICGR